MKKHVATLGLFGLLLVGSVIGAGQAGAATPTASSIDPANFVSQIDNPYFPLVPGTTFRYEGTEAGVPIADEMTVTSETKTILGVECVVVLDIAYEDGEVIEETRDWFAQDTEGNVWYFGEDSRTIENGEVVDTHGSWEAGVDGAVLGIIMPAGPEFGVPYQQEFYPGEAEDMAVAIVVTSEVSVQAGDFQDVLVTREWNPLDPGVGEDKLYAPGVGMILAVQVEGGDERLELVEVAVASS